MPLDELQDEIIEEAKKKGKELVDTATASAAQKMKEARAQAARVKKDAESILAEEERRAREEHQAENSMQEDKEILTAKERVIEELLPKIRNDVTKKIREKSYRKIFDEAIEEALAISPVQELTFMVNKKDERFVKGLGGKVVFGGIGNGVIVYADDGNIKIVATVESLFQQKVDEIKGMLMKDLFEKKETQRKVRRIVKKVRKMKPSVKKVKKVSKEVKRRSVKKVAKAKRKRKR